MIKKMIRKIFKFFIPQFLINQIKKQQDKNQLDLWEKMGCPVPPPHIVKQLVIAEMQKKYGYQILIETGTYLGDMVEAQKKRFKKIISIELGIDLFKKAQKRFRKDKIFSLSKAIIGLNARTKHSYFYSKQEKF